MTTMERKMVTVQDILERNIQDNIAPVVYFHKQDPKDIEHEVREYVITTRPGSGGEAGGGIHEQYISLLNQIAHCIENKETSLPASWISGFFGSGKSSFAKLLGLALDQKQLPDGSFLSESLLNRDATPDAEDFRKAWERLNKLVDPFSVIFDIGTASRSDELANKTIFREVQKRLGYSSFDQIAYYERLLEEEGKYAEFLKICKAEFGPWDSLKNKKIASQRFSALYSKIYPEQYPDPLDWFDIHQSDSSTDSLSVLDVANGIEEMLNRRAPGKSLFIIIDEMSQYVGKKNERKMLDIQSIVSELGSRLEGRVWLLVTGQERLSDVNENTVLGKMRDRFPPRLRVHLDRANVREIVYARLLKKKEDQIHQLETLIEQPGALSKLKLEGYACEDAVADSLIEHYPLLPGHINLLMDISQGIRNSSTRIQADSGSVRGVLQIIWELFNHRAVNFKDRELGDLVTLDHVYDIQRSALNSDTLLTMDKIEENSQDNPFKFKVAKTIALLEMVQESQPTTEKLIASVLYPSLGSDSILDKVKEALQELEKGHFILEQEKLGWRIQDHAGQGWIRTRDEISISSDIIQDCLFTHLNEIVATVEKPKLHGTPLPWYSWKGTHERLSRSVDFPAVEVDFRYITSQKERNDTDTWINLSKESTFQERFIWVCGDHNDLSTHLRNMLRSEKMIEKHNRSRLDRIKERLLIEEKALLEKLERDTPKTIRTCWLNGQIYFNGTAYKARDKGTSFESALRTVVQDNLDAIYPYFKDGNLQLSKDKDLLELFKPEITSPNPKFLDGGGLGLLKMDAGKVTFTAHGSVPIKIKEYLQPKHSLTSQSLINHFGRPPFGFPRPVLKACLIALLRTEAIVIRDSTGSEMTSFKDPGVKDTMLQESPFNRCEIIHNKDPEVGPREKVACARFFKNHLGQDVGRESDVLVDAVFQYFTPLQKRVEKLKEKIRHLGIEVPKKLDTLIDVLSLCKRDRRVQTTLLALHNNLDDLIEGMTHIKNLEDNLTIEAGKAITHYQEVLARQAQQFIELNAFDQIEAHVNALNSHVTSPAPWLGYEDVMSDADAIVASYQSRRRLLIKTQQEHFDRVVAQVEGMKEFTQLTQDQKKSVHNSLNRVWIESDEADLQPSLIVLKQNLQNIDEMENKARDLVDGFLPAQEKSKVSLNLIRNRTLETETDLNSALDELRTCCMKELNQGKKVRLV
jgi:hypothetical protein